MSAKTSSRVDRSKKISEKVYIVIPKVGAKRSVFSLNDALSAVGATRR
jgi:hypothetical protein